MSGTAAGQEGWLKRLIEGRLFTSMIMGLIVVNAITLGLETSKTVMAAYGPVLVVLDKAILAVFVAELVLKLAVYRWRFFLSGWNVFDFVIVAIALMPATGAFSVLRALRILRVARLISVVPSMRMVVEAMLRAIPGMASIAGLLGIIFYISAVMATKLFGASFPEEYGTLANSAYTLFQLMTLDGWSGEIVKPVMEVYPHAGWFFFPFILFTTFMVLNLFIALIVSSMEEIHAEQRGENAPDVAGELAALRAEIASLRETLRR